MYDVEYVIPVHSQEVLKTVLVENTTHITHINQSIDKYMNANIDILTHTSTQSHNDIHARAHAHAHAHAHTHSHVSNMKNMRESSSYILKKFLQSGEDA